MATNGSIYGTTQQKNLTFRVDWTLLSQDPATRTSRVKLRWICTRKSSQTITNKVNAAWSQSLDGSTTSGTVNFNVGNTAVNADYVWREGNYTIQHNIDGTKTASISGSLDLSGTSAGTCSLSGSIELPQIAVVPPTATGLTYTEAGTAYGAVGAYVAGFTKFNFTATATAGDAPIASYSFYRGTELIGIAYTSLTSATLVMQTYEPSGSWVYKVVVTDTANNTSEYSLTAVTIFPYTRPTISAVTYRSNSSGVEDNDGTYGHFDMSYTVAQVGTNAAVVHKLTVKGVEYTTFPQTISGFDIAQSYDAVYYVEDKLGGKSDETQSVDVSYINFELYPSSENGGASFGEASQEGKFIANLAESIFRGDVSVSGKLNAKLIDLSLIQEYYDTDTTTSTSAAMEKVYTADNYGVVIATVSCATNTQSSHGQTTAKVLKNSDTYAYSMNNYASNSGLEYGANAVAVMRVTTGDTITLRAFSGKSGTKTGYFNLLAIGCTLSTS